AVLTRVAVLRERCTREAVVQTIDDRGRDGPDVTNCQTLWMVPGGQRRRVRETLNVVARGTAIRTEIDCTCDCVVLIIAAHEECLLIRQVEVKPGDVSIQLRRRARIETKTTRVQAVADGVVVCRITLGRGGKHRERTRVYAGAGAVGGGIGSVDFRGGET